jgi:hypothetical protein
MPVKLQSSNPGRKHTYFWIKDFVLGDPRDLEILISERARSRKRVS